MEQRETAGFEYAPGRCIVGRSAAMQEVFRLIERYASSSAAVFITGPTGTGKELVAQAIHHRSGRRGRFVAVNCAGVPDTLFESEFFGHKRGSFTGAISDRQGWFEQAAGGTLFLDEVGEMPLGQQAKLLRAIQERIVTPVGSSKPVPVSARILAATNVDVEEAVEAGRFRQDLLDRLNVLPVRVPPLAERQSDFPLLVGHFVSRANADEGTDVAPPSGQALMVFQDLYGGGSIRVLENAIRRIVVVKRQGRIKRDDLPRACAADLLAPPVASECAKAANEDALRVDGCFAWGMSFGDIMRRIEKAVLVAALRRHDGRKMDTMRELRMTKDVWYRVRGR